MKVTQIRRLIREEIQSVIKEQEAIIPEEIPTSERYIILDPKGNIIKSSLGALKTQIDLMVLNDRLRKTPSAPFLQGFNNTPLAIYDTKINEVVQILHQDWVPEYNANSLDGPYKQYVNMFSIKPKNL